MSVATFGAKQHVGCNKFGFHDDLKSREFFTLGRWFDRGCRCIREVDQWAQFTENWKHKNSML